MTTYIKPTDVEVDHNIFVSKRISSSVEPITTEVIAKFIKACNAAKQTLVPKINDKSQKILPIKFVLRHIKADDIIGRCLANKRYICVEIDYRYGLDLSKLAKTLAHELVHAEQYMTRRLKWSDRKLCWLWENKHHTNMGSTHNTYMNQPWEIEAYARQRQDSLDLLDKYFTM